MYFTIVGAENYFDKLIFLLSKGKFPFQRKIAFSWVNFPLSQKEICFAFTDKKSSRIDRAGDSDSVDCASESLPVQIFIEQKIAPGEKTFFLNNIWPSFQKWCTQDT